MNPLLFNIWIIIEFILKIVEDFLYSLMNFICVRALVALSDKNCAVPDSRILYWILSRFLTWYDAEPISFKDSGSIPDKDNIFLRTNDIVEIWNRKGGKVT